MSFCEAVLRIWHECGHGERARAYHNVPFPNGTDMKFWTGSVPRAAAMLLLTLAVASCDHAGETMEPTVPQEQVGEPQELLGILDPITDPILDPITEPINDLLYPTRTVQAVDQDGKIRTYTLVQEPLLTSLVGTVDQLLTSVTQLVGLSGGTLDLLGHRLVVPSNAVDEPTMFTMSALLTGNIHVDLTAVAPGNSGLVDVGEQGFNRLVRLDLTYERASNVSRGDERKLVILRLNPLGLDHLHQVMPSEVDTRRDRVTTWLDHFSGYCMAM